MSRISSKDTVYGVDVFRSRTEARWALLFDRLGVTYQFEPQTFMIPDGGPYLPDFYLPELMEGCWVEIKGQYPTPREMRKAIGLASLTKQLVFVIYGNYEVYTDADGEGEICNFGMMVVVDNRVVPVQTIWSYRAFLPVFFQRSYKRIVEAAVGGAVRVDGERNPEQYNWNFYDMDRAIKEVMFTLTGQRKFMEPQRVNPESTEESDDSRE